MTLDHLAKPVRSPAAWTVGALVLLLPFEPRSPTFGLAGSRVTALEAAAALAAVVLAWQERRPLADLVRRPPLPLILAVAFAAANLVAALLAPAYRAESGRFALRACALAAFAWMFAAAPLIARRAALRALLAAGALVAVTCALEGTGFTRLDAVLDLFRETRFNVAGARRGTGGTAYPTLAGAWIAAALAAAAAHARTRARPVLFAGAAAAVLLPGLLFTYSRGALAAALAGLCVLAVVARRAGDRGASRAAAAALLVCAAGSAGFALRGEVFRLRLASEGTGAWYAARYQVAEAELRLRPGEERATGVRVVNEGAKAWAAAEGFALSYHWFDPVRRRLVEGPRTPLPKTLPQGDEALLRPVVHAPSEPGCYLLVWDMVQEHTAWLSGQGVPTVTVPAVVGDAAPAECSRALPPFERVGGQPGRRALWPVAAAMWRDRPWTGVGPDNFRRLYGRYAGRAFWDDRVTSNNLFLEVAAGTGLPGLLAFGGMLAAAAARALRASTATPGAERLEAQALLALLAVFLTHGAVDYLLGVTGPYLLLAFVVGAASACRVRALSVVARAQPERGAA